MKNGFYIKSLIVSGIDCPNVTLEFSKNANFIIGPSNTGKSYIFQCINYLLGGSDIPKRIKQSEKYLICFLEVVDGANNIYTIKRSLDGGDAAIYKCSHDNIKNYAEEPEIVIVGSKATKKNRTLSSFFLGLCNLENKKVRANKSGETHAAGFALLRNITLADETKIIKEPSPILGGQRDDETKEKNFLKLLLTGRDDSSIIAKPKPNIVNNRKGRIEVIDELISEFENELSEFDSIYVYDEVDNQIEKLNTSIENIKRELDGLYQHTQSLESTINKHWTNWKENESRLITINELIPRFNLLSEHYNTDKSRLLAINEAAKVFTDFELANCPICGTEFSTENHGACSSSDIENVIIGSENEIQKIMILEKELEETKKNLVSDKLKLLEEIQINKKLHEKTQNEATDYASKHIQQKVSELETYRNKLRDVTRAKRVLERISNLEIDKEKNLNEIEPPDTDYEFPSLSTSMTVELCNEIASLLQTWKYEDAVNVTFSEGATDIVINGNDRKLAGKGYRALSYAAFIIGLMHHCVSTGKPHSALVVLDSPLCTLRSKKKNKIDQKELISDEVKNAFYKNIASFTNQGQIIILENDGPDLDTAKSANYIEFTKNTDHGRYGFFPV